MAFILGSLCNLATFACRYSLAAICPEKMQPVWLIDCSAFIDPMRDHGITGLAMWRSSLAVAVQSTNAPRVVVLDSSLRIVRVIQDARLSDVHSLYVGEDGSLLICSTGNNKIFRIGSVTDSLELVWSYHVESPYLHINSVAMYKGRLLATSHTAPKECGIEPLQKEGVTCSAVWSLHDFEPVVTEIYQPHSLTVSGDLLTCFSSHDSRVLKKNLRSEVIYECFLPGYLRGFATAPNDGIICAASSKRLRSRKSPIQTNSEESDGFIGDPRYMAFILFCDRNFSEQKRLNVSWAGFEWYDLIYSDFDFSPFIVKESEAIRAQTWRQLAELRLRRIENLAIKHG